jgi:phosphotransferase system HPr-like phosphotransfer protein
MKKDKKEKEEIVSTYYSKMILPARITSELNKARKEKRGLVGILSLKTKNGDRVYISTKKDQETLKKHLKRIPYLDVITAEILGKNRGR